MYPLSQKDSRSEGLCIERKIYPAAGTIQVRFHLHQENLGRSLFKKFTPISTFYGCNSRQTPSWTTKVFLCCSDFGSIPFIIERCLWRCDRYRYWHYSIFIVSLLLMGCVFHETRPYEDCMVYNDFFNYSYALLVRLGNHIQQHRPYCFGLVLSSFGFTCILFFQTH